MEEQTFLSDLHRNHMRSALACHKRRDVGCVHRKLFLVEKKVVEGDIEKLAVFFGYRILESSTQARTVRYFPSQELGYLILTTRRHSNCIRHGLKLGSDGSSEIAFGHGLKLHSDESSEIYLGMILMVVREAGKELKVTMSSGEA
ncbi:hypothetical protein AKJ16_DCAP23732 [Drosera capensis]